jgi:hypothetical protein
VVGLLLVLLSVALGARVVAAADDTIKVWALTSDLGPGATLSADDLRPVAVQLADAGSYVRAGDAGPVGYQLARAVGAGELLPKDALAKPGTLGLRRVVIEVDSGTTEGLAKGRLVDIYAVGRPQTAGATPPPPRLVLSGVTVEKVADSSGALGSTGSTRGVALLVQEKSVPDVLTAVAGGDVFLVQVPTAGERRGATS